MLTTPRGCIAKCKQRLKDNLAKVHALQNWQGNTFSESELADRIYIDSLPLLGGPTQEAATADQLAALRPYILIYKSGSFRLETSSAATHSTGKNGFFWEMGLSAELNQNLPDGVTDRQELDRLFDNLLGDSMVTGDELQPGLWDLWDQLLELHDDGPFRVNQEELEAWGDHQFAFLHMRIGIAHE